MHVSVVKYVYNPTFFCVIVKVILVDTYQRTKITDVIVSEEMRLAKALSVSGLSISLTSFCSCMAFFGRASFVAGMSPRMHKKGRYSTN